MDKRKRVILAIQSVSLTISIVASQGAAQFVEERLKSDQKWLPSVVALLVAGCGLYAMRFILERAFDKWERLRRLLLGPQFIEGHWYILFRVDDKPVAFGVTRITSTEEGISFEGEDFQCEGKGRGHYGTDIAILDWPRIKYKYHYRQSIGEHEQHSSEGYGEAQFFEGDHSTQKYSGIFFELLGKRVTYYEGWRVPEEDLPEINDINNPKKREKKIRKFFAQLLSDAVDDTEKAQ